MDDFRSVILSLQSEISLLESDNSSLKSTTISLISTNRSLLATNQLLSAENAKLKEQLGLTSKNSSIPSSKELYKLKRNKIKSSRIRGSQPGHPGTTRTKLAPDEIIELSISDTCACGGHVGIAPKPYVHQKVDLPEICSS